MPDDTWIDTASNWLGDLLAPADSSAPFTPQQSALLQELLKQAFMLFAEEMGSKLGSKLAEFHLILKRMESSSSVNEKYTEEKAHDKSEMNRGKDTTVAREVSNFDESRQYKIDRNLKRKARRLRAKEKCTVQRSLLLQMRPAAELHTAIYSCDADRVVLSLEQLLSRTSNDMGGGIPCNVLASQCRAARKLQGWWRRYKMHSCRVQEFVSLRCRPALKRYCFRRDGGVPSVGVQVESNLLAPLGNETSLQRRISRSIEDTLVVDGHKWSRNTLNKYGAAFASVSSTLANIEVDILAQKLLRSYFHRQGRGGFEFDEPEIASSMIDQILLDEAAMFIHAVGHLQL